MTENIIEIHVEGNGFTKTIKTIEKIVQPPYVPPIYHTVNLEEVAELMQDKAALKTLAEKKDEILAKLVAP